MLSKQEVIDQLYNTKAGRTNSRVAQLMNNGERPELLNALVHYTDYLDESAIPSQRLWHLINNVDHQPLCSCGQPNSFIRITQGYTTYCSTRCSVTSAERAAKARVTYESRYGHIEKPAKPPKLVKEKVIIEKPISNSVVVVKQPKQQRAQLVPVNEKEKMTYIRPTDNNVHYDPALDQLLYKWLDEAGVSYLKNDRTLIEPHELDIVIPEHNVAIEIDKLWYHSDVNGYDKNRHLLKTDQCLKYGFRLIHLYDFELRNFPDKCKSLILSAVHKSEVVYARSTTVVELTNKQQMDFLALSHIQKSCTAAVVYGLIEKKSGEIVACMTFGHSRYNKHYDWELLRYASLPEVNVVGGASKLFNHFIKQKQPKNCISYCDRRLFTGNMYTQLGFEYSHKSNINYWYFTPFQDRLYHRTHFQKHKLQAKLEHFDQEQTEWENMTTNGWNRIWDCGNWVFSWPHKLEHFS